MTLRICASCRCELSAYEYSNNQWRKGPGVSRCYACVEGDYWGSDSDGYTESCSDNDQWRQCCACGQTKASADFSDNQWYKGDGASRCVTCVNSNRFPTARRNLTCDAEIYFGDGVYASGAFRDVYRGRYTGGANMNKACVAKIFRDKRQEAAWYQWDAKVVAKATQIVHDWNNMKFGGPTIQVNQPDSIHTNRGRALLEPFIGNYMKWNSNSGAVEGGRHSDMMQALSHYSYHRSSGQFVLCDVQGGTNGSSVIISDPALLSQNQRFGPTDLGRFGIWRFFYHHQCNGWCEDGWQTPNVPSGYNYSKGVMMSTSMVF